VVDMHFDVGTRCTKRVRDYEATDLVIEKEG